ncbi:DUF2085 domain-containing protein [Methanobrevibacter oralis]
MTKNTQYNILRESNNALRFITGLLGGIGLGMIFLRKIPIF